MKTLRIALALAALAFFMASAFAQVPQLINYQGRVAVSGTGFTGTGQFKFALVNAAGTTTFWSNDGTSTAGSQPTAAVSLSVTSGLYSVLLGDTTVPNMTAIPASVFANSDVRLRVWFNDGVNGSQLLTPDQQIAAVAYAMMAGNVPDASITSAKLAAGAVTATSIASGTITGTQLAAGTVTATNLANGAAAANLNATGQTGVASGGLVLSTTENTALLGAGYVKLGTITTGDAWQWRYTGISPTNRTAHTAVWTGTEMIVWGGFTGSYLNVGGRFNPAANIWTPLIATSGVPAARAYHTAAWTGTEMIVWGGFNGVTALGDGGRYNPASGIWAAVSTTDSPASRYEHTAVWTGTEMIVWGGWNSTVGFNNGGRYDPAKNSWTSVSLVDAPVARVRHTAVWTGTEMIAWGGLGSNGQNTIVLNDGGRYSPASDSWFAVTTSGAPGTRAQHTAVWTGTEMIVWGGLGTGGVPYPNDGGRYNPATDSWNVVTTPGAPSGRRSHMAVWTGTEMIVWGGRNSNSNFNDGGRYNPEANTWTAVPTTDAPAGRNYHTAVWSGTEMIVWGGYTGDIYGNNGGGYFGDGGRYRPSANRWIAVAPTGLSSARYGHTALWTGSEMIVWGGYTGSDYLGDGGRYNPTSNSWAAVSYFGGRNQHTAVWTGTEMIVWGGYNGSNLNDGGRYNPTNDDWTAVSTTGAPGVRHLHTAVWTGSEMIIWGGTDSSSNFSDGGRYRPTTDSWAAVTATGAPSARYLHTAVWTGAEMIVWGGTNGTNLNDGARYNPADNSWIAVSSSGAPAARQYHTAVWTGGQMIIWGGMNSASTLNDGARLDVTGNSPGTWSAVSLSGAPAGRIQHTAVWTGTEMIVWGGNNNFQLNDGGRYNPEFNIWTAVTTAGAPSARTQHTAVWTGTEMIVFGGAVDAQSYYSIFSYTPGRAMYLYQRP